MQIANNKLRNSTAFKERMLTDEKLYELCEKYGFQARLWRQKFIGLLPEVNRRRLYEKKGFFSIFEFAFKLAGLSEEQVMRALNLEKKFRDKPDLHKALVNGEVSVNKLARVAAIATSENQDLLVEQVKVLPKSALEVFVRDEKTLQVCVVPGHKQDEKTQIAQGQTYAEKLSKLQLSGEALDKLIELQNKGIDINALILGAIQKREQEITQEKEKLASAQMAEKASRYIPVKIKRILREEYGIKCSMPNCQKPAAVIHHTQRFGLSQNHDPRFMAPLCREHHTIAHSMDIKYHQMRHMSSAQSAFFCQNANSAGLRPCLGHK